MDGWMDGWMEEKAHTHNYPHKAKFLLSKCHAMITFFYYFSFVGDNTHCLRTPFLVGSFFLPSFSFHFEKEKIDGTIFDSRRFTLFYFSFILPISFLISFLEISSRLAEDQSRKTRKKLCCFVSDSR